MVSDLLLKILPEKSPARPLANLHASALTNQDCKFCAREVVLSKALGRKSFPQMIDAALRITFDEGKDKQNRLTHDWLKDHAVGFWKCAACGYSQWGKKPGKLCKDHTSVWNYEECVFRHPSGAKGSTDLFVDLSLGKLRMVEVKIIKGDLFEKLKAPLAEHRVRTQLYLKMIEESDHPMRADIDTSMASVLYFMRGHGKKVPDTENLISPMKEYIVHRNDAEVEHYLTPAYQVTKSREQDWGLYPQRVCANVFDSRTYACAVVKECFSGKYPPNMD